jgi:Holliday junction resolvasome RuvABC ATP-dependent DNA helicase subunit
MPIAPTQDQIRDWMMLSGAAVTPPTRQKQWFFHSDGEAPSLDERRWAVDSANPDCPFSRFIGNERAIKRLSRSAFSALGKRNHLCRENSWALLGPASTGKTTLAKLYAELLELPFVEIHPRSIKTANDLLVKIAEVCEQTMIPLSYDGTEMPTEYTSLELVPHKQANHFYLPPMIVFIDEVHSLRNNVVQSLLKATEKKDSELITEGGWTVNTHNVCWMIATTDRGLLFDAFDTRFTKVHLRLYSSDEIAKIVNLDNPDWSDGICNLVAKYAGRVPREALGFANEMRLEEEMNPGNWEKVAWSVAQDHGIDEFGMTHQRIGILVALGQQGAIAKARMGDVASCKTEELEKFIMPPLMATTPDQKPLVTVTSKGYTITHAGLEELDRRTIDHLGDESMPQSTRQLVPFHRMGGHRNGNGSYN